MLCLKASIIHNYKMVGMSLSSFLERIMYDAEEILFFLLILLFLSTLSTTMYCIPFVVTISKKAPSRCPSRDYRKAIIFINIKM